jgi:hypothetical protein
MRLQERVLVGGPRLNLVPDAPEDVLVCVDKPFACATARALTVQAADDREAD